MKENIKIYVEIMAEPRLGVQTWHRVELPGNGDYSNDMELAIQYEGFFHAKGIVARIMIVKESINYALPE